MKVAGIALGLSLATGIGVAVGGRQAKAAEAADSIAGYTLLYENACPKNTSNNTYASNYDVTVGDVDWKAPGNQYADGEWRIGGKNLTNVDRVVYSKTVVPDVNRIRVKWGTCNLSSVSVTITIHETASDAAAGSNALSTFTGSNAYAASSSKDLDNDSGWSDCFIRIVATCSAGSSNKYVALSSVAFYAKQSSGTPSVAFSSPTDSVGKGNAVTNAATGLNLGGASISYSSGNTSIATVNASTGEVTGVAFGSTTITATATVSGVDYSDDYTIYVTSSSTAYYTVAQARAAIDSGKGLTGQYVKGVVYQVDSYNSTYHSVTYWISDNGSSSVPFEVYSGLGIGGANFSSKDDIKVGDIVVVTGELKKNSSTYEFNYNNQLVSQIHVASIAVKTAPSDVDYAEGEYFDPTGLVVTATYDNSPATTMDFAYADLGSAFTFNPTTSTALTNQNSVSISLFGASTTQAITVTGRTIKGITVTGDMTNKTYVKDASWDLTGLSLTVAYDSGDPAVVTLNSLTVGTDFTLSKATADGATSLTISGTYDGHSITSRTITGITYVSEVTFTAGTDQGSSGSQSADSMSKCGITVSGTSMATTTAQYRIYSGSTLTISSSGENIRKIEFTDAGDSSNPASRIALKDGETGTYSSLTWVGNDDSVAFSPDGQARVSAIAVTTDSGYAEVHVSGLSVNGSAATIGQEFNIDVVKSKTYSLDVAVTPDNTTDSKTINYSVASGSGATVSAAGVITAGSTVGGTAVIRAESDADSTYYVLFNVTVIDAKTAYRLAFSHETTGDSNTALTTETWSDFAIEDASDLTCTDTTRVYPAHNTALKFGGSSNGGTITLKTPNSVAIERVIIHAKNYGTDSASASVNSGTSQALTDEYKYYVFDLSTASDEITIASASASKCRFYVDDIYFLGEDNQAAVGAFGYAAEFMNALDEECSNLAVTTGTWSTLSGKWTTMGTSYSGSQAYFLGKTAAPRDAEGLTPTGDVIQKALARYDFVVGKYLKGQGLSSYNDFMSRNPAAIGAGLAILPTVENETTGAIVTIVTLTSVAAVGGFFFLRKRRLFK